VQPDHAERSVVLWQLHPPRPPEGLPRPRVPDPQPVEAVDGGQLLDRRLGRLGDGPVPGGEDGHHLLQCHVLARGQLHADVVADPPALAHDLPHDGGRVRGEDPRPRGLGHPDARLRGLHQQQDRLVVEAVHALAAHRRQVRPGEVAVTGDPRVAHRAVQPGAHGQAPGPVLGRHRRLQRRDVGPVHRHQPALDDPRGPAGGIAQAGVPQEDPLAQVQLLPVLQDLVAGQVQPGPAVDAQGGDEPVGQVDDALVHDLVAVDVVGEAVVRPGDIGAGVVHTVGRGLGHGAAGGQVAVAERAQALAPALLPGHEALQPVGPGGHRGARPRADVDVIRSASGSRPVPGRDVRPRAGRRVVAGASARAHRLRP
jgi:hypothetical protein